MMMMMMMMMIKEFGLILYFGGPLIHDVLSMFAGFVSPSFYLLF